jgi:hypothetical protein
MKIAAEHVEYYQFCSQRNIMSRQLFQIGFCTYNNTTGFLISHKDNKYREPHFAKVKTTGDSDWLLENSNGGALLHTNDLDAIVTFIRTYAFLIPRSTT